MDTYHASASRSENQWHITIHGLPVPAAPLISAPTWATSQEAAEKLVASLLGVPREKVEVLIEPEDPELLAHRKNVTQAEEARNTAQANLNAALEQAAKAFLGVTTSRDAGEILGYSHQYINKVGRKP